MYFMISNIIYNCNLSEKLLKQNKSRFETVFLGAFFVVTYNFERFHKLSPRAENIHAQAILKKKSALTKPEDGWSNDRKKDRNIFYMKRKRDRKTDGKNDRKMEREITKM